jgi:DNA-binding SARP family transcriptional activator
VTAVVNPKRVYWHRHTISRIASLVAVICLAVGAPLLLWATHATPPVSLVRDLLFHPAHFQIVLARPLDDGAVTKLIWLVAWLSWLWLVVCIVLEIVGRIRGRAPRTLPGSRHIQSLVTYLVGASLAFGAPSRLASPLRLQAAAASAPTSFDQLDPIVAASKSGHAPIVPEKMDRGPLVATSTVAFGSSERIYVVKPRDTLWSIAAAEFGSPLDWRLIAAANYGRLQPDGEELVDDHWIRPGWLLVIPAFPDGLAGGAQTQSFPLTSVRAGDTVEGNNGAPDPSAPVFSASTKAPVESRPYRTSPVSASRPSSKAPAAPITHHDSNHPGLPHIPVAPIGYGLLGAGIVALLERMRRAQHRLRPTGLRIALPEGDLVELERGLRISADPGSVDWIDLSLRLLSVTVRRNHLEPPVISAVRLRDNSVEIMFDPTSKLSLPPPPFETGPDGKSWVLAKNGPRLDALRIDPEVVGIDAPLPALVTFGRNELGLLLVNIETAGSIAVSGTEKDALIQAVAVELATGKWVEQIDLVLVGFGEDKEGLERVSHANSLRSVVAKMERRVRERATLLALVERATNTETRWLDGGDAWDLCVVVCSSDLPVEELGMLDDLVAVAGDGSLGVAVICAGDVVSARWRVRADGGRVSGEGVGRGWSSLSRQPVPTNFAEGVAALVAVAAKTSGVTPDEGPYDKLSLRVPDRATSTLGEKIPEDADCGDAFPDIAEPGRPAVEVRVLGQVEILGAARQFTRAWAVELVVYLAVHPGGVNNEQWATALWPERAMAASSLHSTASAARRSLGTSSSGDDHLPRSRGRLALGPDVKTDWDRFVDLSKSTTSDDWRQALRLIRGRPFDGLRSPDWVVLEGILATVDAVVVDLACRYAERCLEALDPPGAEWAARQGLRVSPYDERLYRVLLKASDAAGNPAGVESIMAELVHLVADDVEPFDAVHPETLSLYRKLSRRSFASRGR